MVSTRIALPSATALLLALSFLGAWALPVHAQEQGFPPWPIIYSGTVEVDGERLASGVLTGRIGDWSSDEVPVVDGEFRCADPCLIVGPPTFDYVGQEVTFHLDGVGGAADLRFKFPALDEPSRRTETLAFSTSEGVSTLMVLIGLGLAVVVGGGVVFLVFRGEKDPLGAERNDLHA